MNYLIGSKNFKSKKTIKDYFSYILKNNRLNTKLTGQYLKDVKGLLEYHPEYSEKVGCGIDYIVTEKHIDIITGHPDKSPHFHIYRTDGINIDFSYNSCISNIPSNRSKKVSDNSLFIKEAMRFIVKPQIINFRNQAFGKKQYLKCPVLEVNFSKRTCNIDHEPPLTFNVLVYNFMIENNLKFSDIELLDLDGIYSTIKDEEIRDKWFNFHLNNAKLRAIHKTANISQKKILVDWSELDK